MITSVAQFLVPVLLFMTLSLAGQSLPPRIYPVIHSFGGVFEIPDAIEGPDKKLSYNIVIEVERESLKPDTINWALNNVARLINLHAAGGIPTSQMNIVLAIHGGATYTIMDNESYRLKYGTDNPNLKLYKELSDNGVKMFVCGQSVIAREVNKTKIIKEVKLALSMLTTLTTYQLKGYAVLKF